MNETTTFTVTVTLEQLSGDATIEDAAQTIEERGDKLEELLIEWIDEYTRPNVNGDFNIEVIIGPTTNTMQPPAPSEWSEWIKCEPGWVHQSAIVAIERHYKGGLVLTIADANNENNWVIDAGHAKDFLTQLGIKTNP